MSLFSSLGRLSSCVEAKLARGMTKRALESKADVAEVKDVLDKISARIESFLVSAAALLAKDQFSTCMIV